MQKVAIIGAGNVGGLIAMRIAESGIADVVLIDVLKNIAEAKALDIEDSLGVVKSERKIFGTDDFSLIKDCRIIVITAGLARKPGMSREELLEKNANVIKDISLEVKEFAPKSIIIVVTNPVDIMSYFVYKIVGCKPNRILGMGSNLDTARFKNLIAKRLNIKNSKIKAVVMGVHGEGMLPLNRFGFVGSKKLTSLFSRKQLETLIEDTIGRGTKIVSLFGTGSAYFGPSRAILEVVEAILKDKKNILSVSCFLNGEYGLNDIFMGVPAKIGKNGVEKIIELPLNMQEKVILQKASLLIKKSIQNLNYA